jgi:DNA-binding NarL/FixJ family response regulator
MGEKLAAIASTIRLLLAHDHMLFRQLLRRSQPLEPRFEIVGEAADEAIRQAHAPRPNMILMDL